MLSQFEFQFLFLFSPPPTEDGEYHAAFSVLVEKLGVKISRGSWVSLVPLGMAGLFGRPVAERSLTFTPSFPRDLCLIQATEMSKAEENEAEPSKQANQSYFYKEHRACSSSMKSMVQFRVNAGYKLPNRMPKNPLHKYWQGMWLKSQLCCSVRPVCLVYNIH